jgi:hypothetical protein
MTHRNHLSMVGKICSAVMKMALGVSDEARATKALRGIVGKRLMYKGSSPASISDQDN